jgi:hypothetical protein
MNWDTTKEDKVGRVSIVSHDLRSSVSALKAVMLRLKT